MSDMTAAEFAAHRRLTGLTYDELSDELGVHQRTVRSWESGRHPVPERVGDEMRDLVDKNARLGRQLAEAGDDAAVRRTINPQIEVADHRRAEKVIIVELERLDLGHHRVHTRVLAPPPPEAAVDLGHPAILGFFSKPSQGVAKDAHLLLIEICRCERVQKPLQLADHPRVALAALVETGGEPAQNRVGAAQ